MVRTALWLAPAMLALSVPAIAWSLYGRGLAKLRKGQNAAAQADFAAATVADPHIKDEAARYRLTP